MVKILKILIQGTIKQKIKQKMGKISNWQNNHYEENSLFLAFSFILSVQNRDEKALFFEDFFGGCLLLLFLLDSLFNKKTARQKIKVQTPSKKDFFGAHSSVVRAPGL